MNFTEVKRENKQGNSGFHVVPLAAESVRQARQSAHSHSDSEVRSFDVASANQFAVGIADPRLNDSALQFGRTVTRRAFRHASVNLDQLAIVNAGSEAHRNSVRISGHSVSRKLKVASSRLVQFFNKDFGIVAGAAAKVPSKDQLAAPFDCQKRPRVALSLIVRVPFVTLFAIAKSPKFVGLNFIDLKAVDPVLQQSLTLVASDSENAKHSRNSHVAQSSGRANATAFGQAIKNAEEFFIRQIDRLHRLACSIRERALAVAAFESESFVPAKMAVKVSIISAVIRAFHSVTKSFLTETLFEPSIMVTGLDWRQQRQSGLGLAGCYKHSASLVEKLVGGIRVERMKDVLASLLDLQSSAFSHSASLPLINSQRTSTLLLQTTYPTRILWTNQIAEFATWRNVFQSTFLKLIKVSTFRLDLRHLRRRGRCRAQQFQNSFSVLSERVSRSHNLVDIDLLPVVFNLLNFLLFFKALEGQVKRCQKVLISRYVKANLFQSFADFRSGQWLFRCFQHTSNSGGQTGFSNRVNQGLIVTCYCQLNDFLAKAGHCGLSHCEQLLAISLVLKRLFQFRIAFAQEVI